MSKRIYLYGLTGVRGAYKVIRYEYVEDCSSIRDLRLAAFDMTIRFGAVESVYAVDARPGLATEYRATLRKNSLQENIMFKDMLEREGIRVI